MLSASVLSGLMRANVRAAFPWADDWTDDDLTKLTDALAAAVVDHVTAAAVVTVTGVEGGSSTRTGTVA